MGMMGYTNPLGLNPPVSVVGTGNPALDQSGEGRVTESGDPMPANIDIQYPGDNVLDQSNNGIMGYDKYLKPQLSQEIIGIQSPRLVVSDTAWTPTQVTADFTTYYDRAVVKLRNEAGSTQTLHAFAIGGQLVVRVSGKNGYLWEASNYDDIERNGELDYKLGNEFVVNGTQIESIGDWLQKELRPHDMYKLYLKGVHPFYEEGDRYTLNVTHILPGSTSQIEELDIDVQICGVSITREVGQLGQTVLSVRVPTGAWSKTTTTRARLLTAGLPFGTIARGGTIKVAASMYTGTDAHFYCDGTDDQVQINNAIVALGKIGGGIVQLTRGTFNISEISTTDVCIEMGYNNISLIGEGMYATIISMACPADDDLIAIYNTAAITSIQDIGIIASGTYSTKSKGILIYNNSSHVNIMRCYIKSAICVYDDSGTNTGINITYNTFYPLPATSITICCAIYMNSITSGCIGNNKIVIDSTSVLINGIYLGGICSNMVVVGNNIILGDTTGFAIGINYASNDSNNKNVVIDGNTIKFTGAYASVSYIYGILADVFDSVISNNIVLGASASSANAIAGIYIGNDRNQIHGNNVNGMVNPGAGVGYGIYLASTSTQNNVISNICLSNDTQIIDISGTNTIGVGNVTS
jgi:hypothetical protein